MCDFNIKNETIIESFKKIKTNNLISDYYLNLANEENANSYYYDKFISKSSRIKNCYKYWKCNLYNFQKVIDVKNIGLCHDKFCRNCQNEISKKRYSVYTPILEELSKEYSIYHCVFTVKNPIKDFLNQCLEQMYNKFVYIIGYLKGSRKIKNLDLSYLGYKGCIRTLEITCKKRNGIWEYHPHFHCILVLDKNLKLSGNTINDFSYSKSNGFRKFSDVEVLLQKIWYLVYNNKKVTKKSIEELEQGYSVILDKANSIKDYKEIFKYTIKESFGEYINNFDLFKELVYSLIRRRTITTYGCFKNYTDKELEELIDKETIDYYYKTISDLSQTEDFTEEYIDLKEIKELAIKKEYKFISKNSIKNFISDLEKGE